MMLSLQSLLVQNHLFPKIRSRTCSDPSCC
ncbi:hypothetical protein KPSA1_06110 [Pseudomonas syringae pv. actinidiae]|uniref:Uncharacterized protein n=1 Tax=Pseudomonas syringae pv. actinidiae TaxID=103796 RepID=A0A2V0QI19_PSESF|nr:hypothetical protein KPSA1_06110 [Pseudomonas syringae pv. actinidiae]